VADWFYDKQGQQQGPVDAGALGELVRSGTLSPDTLVWKEGMGDWQPYRTVAELNSSSSQTSPYQTPASNPYGGGSPQSHPVTSGLAIASLVCGIVGLFFCCFHILFSVPAVVCGHLALNEIAKAENRKEGRGLAIAGLICGYIGIALTLFFLLAGMFGDSEFEGFDEIIEELENIEDEAQESAE